MLKKILLPGLIGSGKKIRDVFPNLEDGVDKGSSSKNLLLLVNILYINSTLNLSQALLERAVIPQFFNLP